MENTVTGAAHYRRAEEILRDLTEHDYDDGLKVSLGLQALIHATLANAAATALGDEPTEMRNWNQVAGSFPVGD
jgi:hypothetical protein